MVSQPANAWATGTIWQGVGDKVRFSSWTGILAWFPLHLWLFQWEITSAPDPSVDLSLGKICPEQYSELAKVDDVDSSAGLNTARKLIANLYDLKKKCVSCHENLNKLMVKLATCKDTNMVRLSPIEPSLYQHVLRSSLQTKIWFSSNIAKPPPLSPYDYVWWKDAAGPLPLFFEGIMTSDLQKVMCGRSCVCNEQTMCCTEQCPCQGSDFCMNPLSRWRENDRDSEDDEETIRMSRVFIIIFLFIMSC